MSALAICLALYAASAQSPNNSEQLYLSLSKSVFTIEVHTGDRDTKASVGSGYLVDAQGTIVTNYHVVSRHISDPTRHAVRVRRSDGTWPARLVQFDLANDLALLRVDGLKARPLTLAASSTLPQGASIVSFGNVKGMKMSVIDGLHNGHAQKGLVDRVLLSMPLNSGMSGGPILNSQGDVVATNVSILWLSNDVSFGVPIEKVHALLEAPPLAEDAEDFHGQLQEQLLALESRVSLEIQQGLDAVTETSTVGGAVFKRMPSFFDCWSDVHEVQRAGLVNTQSRCDLQFSPQLGRIGEVPMPM